MNKQRIEEYVAKMIKADNPIDNWKGNTFIHTKFHCVGCNKKLTEGKNIHMGYHLCICRNCRLEYLDAMTKEVKK